MENQKSEATIFFIDELIHEVKQVIKKPPVKNTMIAYISAWLNTLETIKSLNEGN